MAAIYEKWPPNGSILFGGFFLENHAIYTASVSAVLVNKKTCQTHWAVGTTVFITPAGS